MKLHTLALFTSLALSSCSIFSKKADEDSTDPSETSDGPLIPPPTSGPLALEQANEPEKELPPFSSKPEEKKAPKPADDDNQFQGYVFRDDLQSLPSKSKLATPVSTLPPPSNTKKDDQSSLSTEVSEPLVTNP